MITYNYFGKEQKIYYEKLSNGLDVYVMPNKTSNRYHIELVTRYGSDIDEFIPVKEKSYVKIPHGLAHFLEHKAFDMPEGDAINYFTKKGIYANASTNYFCTKYYLDGKKFFASALDYLLTMVFTPYFKDESINNERGIISQEIQMYDDEVDWILDRCARECLLHNILKGSIAGTKEDLKLINSDIMNKVYDTFYQPSNMFLIVSGNVFPKKVFDTVRNNKALNGHISNYPIVYKEEKEDVTVKEEYKELKANVLIPKLKYTFKLDMESFKFNNQDKLKMYLGLLFTHLFSEGSNFDETITFKNLSTSYFCEHLFFKNIYLFSLEIDSEYADLVIEEINKVLANIDISESDFERLKKVWYSLMIRSIDNIVDMAESLSNDLIKGTNEFDAHLLIDSLRYDELSDILKQTDFSNKSLVLMLPKESD